MYLLQQAGERTGDFCESVLDANHLTSFTYREHLYAGFLDTPHTRC